MVTKKVVQDIIPSSRRSIRLVPLARTEKKEKEIEKNIELEKDEDIQNEEEIIENKVKEKKVIKEKERVKVSEKDKKPSSKGRFSKIVIFGIILISVALIGLALSLLYSKAIVTVTPERLDLNINGNFIAKKDSNTFDSLGYQVITISEQANKSIPATDGPLVQTKAKGTVTLFNSFSSTTQKIVAGTRLTNTSGLVYKTLSTVTIPGKKILQGKVVFGSVVVGIIAEQAGANYNIKPLDLTGDFKFLGYKGTTKYDGFFGRIKADIVGGFSGNKKTISTTAQTDAANELKKTIESKLLARVAATIPTGYMMFEKSYTIEYQDIASSTDQKNLADVSIKGILYGVIFNSKTMIDFIAKKQIQDSRLLDYKIDGLKSLTLKIVNDKDFSPKKGNTLSFNLLGQIRITGIINETELKTKLIGLRVKEIDNVIKTNPSVKYATVLLTPFWMRSFPNSPEKITIDYK